MKLFVEKGNHSNAENINYEDLMLENPIREIILIKSELKQFVKKENHSNAENINCGRFPPLWNTKHKS